jgi:hypothetical protein
MEDIKRDVSVPTSGSKMEDTVVTAKVENEMDEDEETLVRLQEESIQLQQDKIRLQEERLQLLEEKLQLRREKNQVLAEQRTLLLETTKKRKVPPSTDDDGDAVEITTLRETLALQEKELEAQASMLQQQDIKLQELTNSSATPLHAVVTNQDEIVKEEEAAPVEVAPSPTGGETLVVSV